MHWWMRQKVSNIKRRAFSMKSSRQATRKKSLTRTCRMTCMVRKREEKKHDTVLFTLYHPRFTCPTITRSSPSLKTKTDSNMQRGKGTLRTQHFILKKIKLASWSSINFQILTKMYKCLTFRLFQQSRLSLHNKIQLSGQFGSTFNCFEILAPHI